MSLHIKLFNDKVRAMDQSNAKILTLNPQEARSLHAEIYDLLVKNAELNRALEQGGTITTIGGMDGGTF